MKRSTIDAAQVWREIEDRLAPRLRITLIERAVYCHLLRHTRLEGRPQRRCSINWLSAGVGISPSGARKAVRSLAEKGAVQIVERSKKGHVVRLRLPQEVAECRKAGRPRLRVDLDALDFLRERPLRDAIHHREAGRCFYCRRRLHHSARALDHVFPRAEMRYPRDHKINLNSYRNLVSCCGVCNSEKKHWNAVDFLRKLYRDARLSPAEFADRRAALKALAAGRLKPVFTV